MYKLILSRFYFTFSIRLLIVMYAHHFKSVYTFLIASFNYTYYYNYIIRLIEKIS